MAGSGVALLIITFPNSFLLLILVTIYFLPRIKGGGAKGLVSMWVARSPDSSGKVDVIRWSLYLH